MTTKAPNTSRAKAQSSGDLNGAHQPKNGATAKTKIERARKKEHLEKANEAMMAAWEIIYRQNNRSEDTKNHIDAKSDL